MFIKECPLSKECNIDTKNLDSFDGFKEPIDKPKNFGYNINNKESILVMIF